MAKGMRSMRRWMQILGGLVRGVARRAGRPALIGTYIGGVATLGIGGGSAGASTGPEIERLIAEYPEEREHIEEIQTALAENQRLKRDVINYFDLLEKRPALREKWLLKLGKCRVRYAAGRGGPIW